MAQLVKTVNQLAIASCKTVNGLAIASVKTINGLDNTSGGNTLVKYENFASAASGIHTITDITGWSNGTHSGLNTNGSVSPVMVTFGQTSGFAEAYYSGAASTSLGQRIEVEIQTPPDASHYVGAMCRKAAGADSYYCFLLRDGALNIEKVVAGVESALTSNHSVNPVAGDKFAIEVNNVSGSGTRLKCQKNIGGGGWVDVFTNVDPGDYLSAGYGGLTYYGASTSVMGICNFYWYDLP